MNSVQGLLLGVVLLGTACAHGRIDPTLVIRSERETKVEELAEAYGLNLRFGRVNEAARAVHPDLREDFLSAMTDPAGAPRFTHFELESVELSDERERANVRARFGVYRPPSINERLILERQIWRYDPALGAWFLAPDLHLYRGDVGAEER